MPEAAEIFVSKSDSCPGRKDYNPNPEPDTIEAEFPHELLSPQQLIEEYRLYLAEKPADHGPEFESGKSSFLW